MKDVETIRLYLELLDWCKTIGWTVDAVDMHGRIRLLNEKTIVVLYSNSIHECIGYVTGYMRGRNDGFEVGK